eukprot:1583620-Pleurochrysis_carterae.AAC.1
MRLTSAKSRSVLSDLSCASSSSNPSYLVRRGSSTISRSSTPSVTNLIFVRGPQDCSNRMA